MGVLLLCLWAAWTAAETGGWIIGLPIIIAGFFLLTRLPTDPLRLRPAALVPFGLYFLRESVRGGWNVSRRALRRQVRLQPDLIQYDTRLPEGPARVFLINCISLMPGTATVEREEGHLKLHVLDHTQDCAPELRRLERHVAALFGLAWVEDAP